MAQSAVTVRIDSEMKSQFDELCEQFGMSANTAFNIFVKAVIRSRSIPFAIRGAKTGSAQCARPVYAATQGSGSQSGARDDAG